MPTTKKTAKKAVKKATKKVTKKATKSVAKKASPRKKPAAKKPAAKKTAKKTVKKKPALKHASNQESFWVRNGEVLNSMVTLADALERMEKEVFGYHVTKEKNDFADWVEKVLDDAVCAGALRKCKSPRSARTVVVRHIKLYSV